MEQNLFFDFVDKKPISFKIFFNQKLEVYVKQKEDKKHPKGRGREPPHPRRLLTKGLKIEKDQRMREITKECRVAMRLPRCI